MTRVLTAEGARARAWWLEENKDSALPKHVLENLRGLAKALPEEGEALESTKAPRGQRFYKAEWRNSFRRDGGYSMRELCCGLVGQWPRVSGWNYVPPSPKGRVAKDQRMICCLEYEFKAGNLTQKEYAVGAWLVLLRMSRYRKWMTGKTDRVWFPEERMEKLLD
jgi:hypothetical protein